MPDVIDLSKLPPPDALEEMAASRPAPVDFADRLRVFFREAGYEPR